MTGLEQRSAGEAPEGEIVAALRCLDDPAPDPRSLYYKWESEQWEAGALTFAKDRSTWHGLEDDERASVGGLLGCFLVPEGRVTDLLVPFVDAVSSEEEQVFLTSQLVDEARAVVFCERLEAELTMDDTPGRGLVHDNGHLERLLLLASPRADQVRLDRKAGPALFEGLLVLSILLDGVLAAPVLRRLGSWMEDRGGFPGTTGGMLGLARDTCRHAHFAIGLLSGALADASLATSAEATSIEALIVEALPLVQGVVNEAAAATNDFSGLPFGDRELSFDTMDCLALRMQDIGIDLPA